MLLRKNLIQRRVVLPSYIGATTIVLEVHALNCTRQRSLLETVIHTHWQRFPCFNSNMMTRTWTRL